MELEFTGTEVELAAQLEYNMAKLMDQKGHRLIQ